MQLPLTARHVLTLTAGAMPERVSVGISPTVRITVAGATVTPATSTTGPSLTTCPGRWNRMHEAYRFAPPVQSQSTFTIAAGQTATVTADVTLIDTPYNEETLDAEWGLEVGQGRPFSVSSGVDESYDGPLAVQLDLRTIRLADGSYVVAGTAEPGVERGRVELWGYPPRSSRAVRLARVGVTQGEWTYKRWRPARAANGSCTPATPAAAAST